MYLYGGVSVYNVVLLREKDKIMSFAGKYLQHEITLSKISQTHKDKHVFYHRLIYILYIDMYET